MRDDAVLSESCVRILKPCREVRSMTSRPPTNVPASVHQRLLNLARQTNRPFNELLQYFAIQRFLFRFSRSAYAEQFVLKGAQMLQAWDAPLARPTMDIDMLGQVSNTVENLEQIVRACATVEVDADGVEFDPQSVRGEVIVKGKAYEGVRTRLRGTLGKIKLNVQLDFGFGDVVVPEPIYGSICRTYLAWVHRGYSATPRRVPLRRSFKRSSRSISLTLGSKTSMTFGAFQEAWNSKALFLREQ